MTPGVKVCGVGDAAIIRLAARLGARYLGFNFFPPSPRFLTPAAAAGLAAGVPAGIERVAVLVDPDDAFLDALLAAVDLDILQLHGSETPERVAAIRARTGRKVMKALKVATAADVAVARHFLPAADLIMFDAKPPEEALLPGGNGVSFDWGLLAGLRLDRPWALAGGLDADNIEAATRLARPPIIDVSSGVESRPGVKDPVLLERFLVAARRLGRDLAVEERQ
jgi:phosphoribosylanthranilate isomerase